MNIGAAHDTVHVLSFQVILKTTSCINYYMQLVVYIPYRGLYKGHQRSLMSHHWCGWNLLQNAETLEEDKFKNKCAEHQKVFLKWVCLRNCQNYFSKNYAEISFWIITLYLYMYICFRTLPCLYLWYIYYFQLELIESTDNNFKEGMK